MTKKELYIDEHDDIQYFVDKMVCYFNNNDIKNAIKMYKRLKLMEDADIIYRLSKPAFKF